METAEYAKLRENLARLKLTKMAEHLPVYMTEGCMEGKSPIRVMRELTDTEIRFRDERAAEMNFTLSHFPYRKTIDDFDFDYQPSVSRETVARLRTLGFLEGGDNVLLIGNSGVGKTHLATGIGIEATSSHISTYFIHFRDLIARLRKGAAENREECVIRNLNKYRLLIIDEIGYFPVDRTVASLFFQLVAARYEKRSVIVTTNQPLSKWGEIFGDAIIAGAIIDRLVHHSTILRITGRSYRIKDMAPEQKTGAEPLGVQHSVDGKERI